MEQGRHLTDCVRDEADPVVVSPLHGQWRNRDNEGLQPGMESHHWSVEGHSPAQFAEVWGLSQICSFPAIEHCSRGIELAVSQDSIGVHQHNFGTPGKGLDHRADLVREPYVIKICQENYVAAGKADRILEIAAAAPGAAVFDDLNFAGIFAAILPTISTVASVDPSSLRMISSGHRVCRRILPAALPQKLRHCTYTWLPRL
jgi:hypothetical protein